MNANAARFRPIRSKLARAVLSSVGFALALGACISLLNEVSRYRETRREALLASAYSFAAATAEPASRSDRQAVATILRGIARVPRLLRAEFRRPDGAVLSEAGLAVRLERDVDVEETGAMSLWHLLRSRTVEVSVPVVRAGEVVGRLSLVRDTEDLPGELGRSMLVIASGGIVALTLGLWLSQRLQAAITEPLSRLTVAMERIDTAKGYEPSHGIASDDETGLLAARFDTLMADIRRATEEILARENEIVERLARASEQRDDQTGRHVTRVAEVSGMIAQALGLDSGVVRDLVRASPMHDVGKIAVPDSILFKPGRLDVEERREMERHAERGYEVLAGSDSHLIQLAAEIALTHHERWDGDGYPRRLAGEAIPLCGRITAVADVCDALLSERPYKKPWTLDEVRAHLIEESGRHFDPRCVKALLSRWNDLRAAYASA